MRIAVLAICCLFVSSPAVTEADDDASPFIVCVVPLGKHDKRVVAPVVRGIELLYGVETKTLARHKLPKSAYYAPRKRYRADKLLDYLDEKVVPNSGCQRVIGLTAVDISTTKGEFKDWGIFGLATIGGPSGVVSTYRLRRKANHRKLTIRTIKVVNHELGHAMGSPHVAGEGCLMQDAAGTIKTIDSEPGTLCADTIKLIEKESGHELPAVKSIDWDAVVGR